IEIVVGEVGADLDQDRGREGRHERSGLERAGRPGRGAADQYRHDRGWQGWEARGEQPDADRARAIGDEISLPCLEELVVQWLPFAGWRETGWGGGGWKAARRCGGATAAGPGRRLRGDRAAR